MLTTAPHPFAVRLNSSSRELVPDAGLQRVAGSADIENLAERAAHFVALVVLHVRELVRAHRQVRLGRIGVLTHRRQIARDRTSADIPDR